MEKKYYSVCLKNGNYFDNIFSDNPYIKQEFRMCNIYAESIDDDSEVLKDIITGELIYPFGSNQDLEYIFKKDVMPVKVETELNKFKNSTDGEDICLERYKNAIDSVKSKDINKDNKKGRC